ncbi:MAG: acetyltransferase [Solirubrobacterales bacterium]|nr:acetyltransferase [Solirubrobacterales bacterium]
MDDRSTMDGREITIRWAAGPDDLRGAFAVRERVFCDEQGVPREDELDEHDEHALHLVALDAESGGVIGTLRLLLEQDRAKIGRVAVEREWRRRGVALRMLQLALEAARERGSRRVRLAAQLEAVALYEQAGFAVESETFEEAGIQHVWMGLAFAPGGSTDG